MKEIAFPTEGGSTIHQHFGRAPFYVVANVDESGNAPFEQQNLA